MDVQTQNWKKQYITTQLEQLRPQIEYFESMVKNNPTSSDFKKFNSALNKLKRQRDALLTQMEK